MNILARNKIGKNRTTFQMILKEINIIITLTEGFNANIITQKY